MDPRVTAIVVARNAGDHLRRTLDALMAQTRQPDVVIAVLCGSNDDTGALLARYSPTQIVAVGEKLAFGAAVAVGVRAARQPASENEWLWLLGQDTAPEPRALESLLGTVEGSASVAVAGAKLVDWDDARRLRDLGRSMTPLGASAPLVEDELDQGQHDDRSDVLGVAPAGMIVRNDLWQQLGGFDPALPIVDDGLDFCVRARLAGHRVVVAPAARVAVTPDGVAVPAVSTRGRNRRRIFRQRRAAQLHRRMTYAPTAAVVVHWLSLVPLAIVRSLIRLVRKQPSAVGGELAAALATAFSVRANRSRRMLRRHKRIGWSAIRPLRARHSDVNRMRAVKTDNALLRYRGEKQELRFFTGGGIWIVLLMAVVGVAVSMPLLGSSVLTGGSLLPLSHGVGVLWAQLGYGWRDIGVGFVGAADPFTAVLAVLGSVTFWNPSLSLVLVWILALPLAALGGWLAATRITDRMGVRAAAAVLTALAPTFLVALQSGRPTAVLAHLLLPWVFFAGVHAWRSWSAAATTAILTAATLACAPSLAPALLVLWILALVLSGRHLARLIAVPLPTLALFAPLVVQQGIAGNWLAIFADPGVPVPAGSPAGWQLATGFPDALLGGWPQLLTQHGLGAVPTEFVVPLLLAPLGVLALLALFLPRSPRAMMCLGIALVGFLTAVAAVHIAVATTGSTTVSIWPGAGLSLYWLGVVAAATIGLGALRRRGLLPAWIAVVAVATAVAPAVISLPLGTSVVAGGAGRALPAVVTAEAATHPRVGTLHLVPQPGGGLAAQLTRGIGQTLDGQSTLAATDRSVSARDSSLATLAGNLASTSGRDPSGQLAARGIGFVLLEPPAQVGTAAPTSESATTESRAATALAGNAHLVSVAATGYGQLFSFDAGDDAGAATPSAARIPADAGGLLRPLSLALLVVVFGAFLLLALPTGRVTEFTPPRPVRTRRRGESVRRPTKRAAARDGTQGETRGGTRPEESSATNTEAQTDATQGTGPAESTESTEPTDSIRSTRTAAASTAEARAHRRRAPVVVTAPAAAAAPAMADASAARSDDVE